MSRPAGIAPIKPEFLLSNVAVSSVPDDDSAERRTNQHAAPGHAIASASDHGVAENIDSSNNDIIHLKAAHRRKLSKDEKKKRQGANKGRRFGKMREELELCWRVAMGQGCEFGEECRFTHDIAAYLEQKPRDIKYIPDAPLSNVPPFISVPESHNDDNDNSSHVDFSTTCPIYQEKGECKHGLKCRFLGGHARKTVSGELELVIDENKVAQQKLETTELNYLGLEALKQIRSRKYPRPITEAYLQELAQAENSKRLNETGGHREQPPDPSPSANLSSTVGIKDGNISKSLAVPIEDQNDIDSPDVPMKFREKKRLKWQGKTYLAPLTTVGNLPYRRLCVSLGADITCGEMGLATSFLQGSKEEWSLVRKHSSETIFGIQLAGNKPINLVPAAEIIAKEFSGNLDFVDLNCGCPIDLVFKSGSGSALLDTPGKLSRILIGMNKALGDIPLTVKLRTGVKDGRNIAHKIMPTLGPECGVSAVTLHGRSRQQRYTRLSDWNYIKECVKAVRARAADDDLPPIPIFGGGDCFSSESYWTCMEQSGVDGVMVGRGALIKPWIFTEIKERREWDISSRERLELIRKYVEYGLNHFGSDTAGVNTTRRYVCESLSFQHRYIPIGLLEVLPGRINERAYAFRGRDELETLLASPDSRDWVKISEMFLGAAPDNWSFIPKHRSNAFGSEEGNG